MSASVGNCLTKCLDFLFASPRVYDVKEKRLKQVRLVGEGGFAYVYLVEDIASKQRYALKKIVCHTQQDVQDALWEVEVHRTFSHPNIQRLVDYAVIASPDHQDAKEVLMLMPFFERGSLQDSLETMNASGARYTEREVLKIFSSICAGIREFHMHDPPWVHRDIKPQNILLSNTDDPVLMDFGSTAMARTVINSRVKALEFQELCDQRCSPLYKSPELYDVPSECVIDVGPDIWALGCLLYAIAFTKSPFEDIYNDGGVMRLAVLNDVKFPDGHDYSSDLLELIRDMTAQDPADRPGIDTVFERLSELGTDRKSTAGQAGSMNDGPKTSLISGDDEGI